MEELKKNKLVWAIVGFIALNIVIFFGGKIMIDKITDKVIQKLQKEYSPSPYGPGFDPDKINPDTFKTRKVFELRYVAPAKNANTDLRFEFEQERGFTNER